ncbi:LysM peptidoglycan-binding domain-containing protein [Winogradskyella sp. R77965]|uniref:LysM peptidoglycan-binding domain-containing protein n=1 Tax=Winogradskyella sp. R77965 TaxID=3093872 RepID=UPI0037DC8A47
MQRNCKLILSIIALALTSLGAFAQDKTDKKVEYKEVILDGKPAKLNIATGEITFVNPKDKKSPVKFDDFVAQSEARAKAMKNSNSKNDLAKPAETPTTHSESTSETRNTEVGTDFHIVKENETLFDLSKMYNVSLTELKRANNLETTLIDTGQRLRVKNLDVHINLASQKDANASYESYSNNNSSNFYMVEKDDTLFGLARRYNLSVNQLKSINNLNSNLIYVGQKLRITEFGSTDDRNSSSVWTVSAGDTLFSIASKNGTSVDIIKQLNGLTSNLIKVGQKLKLK